MAKAESFSLLRFQEAFGTEEACVDYIMSKRWKDGFFCSKCHHDAYYLIRSRHLFECRKCRYQTSVTAGTLMHKTKQPLRLWFWAIYLVAHDKRGKSALSLSQVLEVNYRTAWRMLHKIRQAMKERDATYMLSGLVEMDDAYFGAPRQGKHGRGTDKSQAVIALSKTSQNHPAFLRIEVIDSVTLETLNRVAKSCIQKGSRIVSDGHTSYKQLKHNGYTHEARAYYKEDQNDFLKMLHNMIGNAKAFIQGTYHGLGDHYLQAYFDEFCFRFNRRQNPNELFDRLLNACVLAKPHPFPEVSA